ncbi:MAG: acyl carrier protein [Alphaproteobacteria bacterium]|nr:acyl carrier protein [Alphaproteobacteria bacterium]
MEKKLVNIINEMFESNFESLEKECNLATDLSIDSLRMMDLVVEIEEEFGISIPDNIIGDLLVFGKLVEFVEKSVERGEN